MDGNGAFLTCSTKDVPQPSESSPKETLGLPTVAIKKNPADVWNRHYIVDLSCPQETVCPSQSQKGFASSPVCANSHHD